MKTNQNLGQDRLMLFPASKTAPPMQIPGYAPALACGEKWHCDSHCGGLISDARVASRKRSKRQ